MAEILDGKMVAQKIKQNLKKDIEDLKKDGIIPKLAVIMVGEEPGSKVYVRNKSIACNELGIDYKEHLLSEDITMEELLRLIDKLNKDKTVNRNFTTKPNT